MYVILVYDITMDKQGKKNLPKIYKTCKEYLFHIQNSVFEGEISEVQIKTLKMRLKAYIREDMDSVIIFKSRDEKWLKKEFWGKEDDITSMII